MEIVVKDTNILIDLVDIGLLERCKALDVDFRTTDMVISELRGSTQYQRAMDFIDEGSMTSVKTEGTDLMEVALSYQANSARTNLTPADWSVLLLAKRLGGRLLTGDQKLVRQARESNIEANGLLWLTDLLVDRQVVTPKDMSGYLQRLLDTNPRAPRELIAKRILGYEFLQSR